MCSSDLSIRLGFELTRPLGLRRTEIYGKSVNAANCWVNSSVRAQSRLVVLNIVGLAALIAFTGLVYLRTQETLILLVGGLISVVSVLGTMMGKS